MLKKFHPNDLKDFEFRDLYETCNILVVAPEYFRDLPQMTGGNAYTICDNTGVPLAICGWAKDLFGNTLVIMSAGVELDNRFSKSILKDFLTLVKQASDGAKRVEAQVETGNEKYKKFIKALGFKKEATLKGYGFGKMDMDVYVL